jgi:3-hydroxy-9,10-secoandrosta-1,3,5(10)-triene-9,17-dione monooxygenase reductase component
MDLIEHVDLPAAGDRARQIRSTPPIPPPCTGDLRAALAAFGSGVTVVTTRSPDGALHGATISSFASVSLSPPLVLWSQACSAGSRSAFIQADHFAVNVLAADQVALANRFAQRRFDKFDSVDIEPGIGGAPLLTGAAAHFECRRHCQYEGGDHTIFVGLVERFSHRRTPTLMVRHGRYLPSLEA